MSDLHIALVAEGPTDSVLIEASLRAILHESFVLTMLQPETTRSAMGGGWCGVLKWCHSAGMRYSGSLDNDPTLSLFDMVILHLDADVAERQYLDCGIEVDGIARRNGFDALPCAEPCPPASDTCRRLKDVLRSWMGNVTPGMKTVLCVPSKSIESWLAVVCLSPGHALLSSLECTMRLETVLSTLPKRERIRKTVRDYRRKEAAITNRWQEVKSRCSMAVEFESDVQSAVH